MFIFFRDVVRIYLFFFSFLLDTLSFCTSVLWPLLDSKHCTYFSFIYIYIYIYDVIIISPISPCVVSFLSLYTCFFMYAISYFCYTLRCLNKFCLKCFRKISCQNLSCHELFSCKVFQEFVLGLDFIVFNRWLQV